MRTRLLCPEVPRVVEDVDFLARFPFSLEETAARLRQALALPVADGVEVAAGEASAEVIWGDTPFPGVRLQVPVAQDGARGRVQVDIGFGDPLVPVNTKPAPGTVIRLDEADPAFNTWPTWDHPLGGPGRWGVVLRTLRNGLDVAPLVEGCTLPPRTLEEHRALTARAMAQAQQDYDLARKSGVYADGNLTPPPQCPVWLLRDLPR